MQQITHASLFSGIGGFDLAAEWMGWSNMFFCENDLFAANILSFYWKNTPIYGNIKTTDFSIWRGRVDVMSGGFPCQPFSIQGKRMATDDDRHLWGEMLRAIQEVEPTYVVAENVYGLLSAEDGMVFEQVCLGLEGEGYDVATIVLPALAVNAPHERKRVWIIGRRRGASFGKGHTAYHTGNRWKKESIKSGNGKQVGNFGIPTPVGFHRFPSQPPVCGGNDGFSAGLDRPFMPREREKTIKAYGNSVVPGLVYQIFKSIEEAEYL